jgi:hypothetical protein
VRAALSRTLGRSTGTAFGWKGHLSSTWVATVPLFAIFYYNTWLCRHGFLFVKNQDFQLSNKSRNYLAKARATMNFVKRQHLHPPLVWGSCVSTNRKPPFLILEFPFNVYDF